MENTNNPINLQKNEPEKDNREEGVLDEYVSGYQQLELEGYRSNINKARNWLLAAAGIFLVSILIQLGDVMDLLPIEYKVIFFGFPVVLALLAFLVHKNPVTILAAALIIFIGYYIGLFVWLGEPAILYGGFVIKILVIAALLKGLKDAREAEQLKKDYEGRGNQS